MQNKKGLDIRVAKQNPVSMENRFFQLHKNIEKADQGKPFWNRKQVLKVLIATVIFTLLLFIITWPLIKNVATECSPLAADVYQIIGQYKKITSGEMSWWQFFDAKGFPLTGLASLQVSLGETLGYNIWWFISFIFAFIGGYLLQLYLTRNHVAAFVTGLAFTLPPFHFYHSFGHAGGMYYGILAFFILALFLYFKRYSWKWFIVLAVLFGIIAKTEHHLTYFAVLLVIFVAAYMLFNRQIKLNRKVYTQLVIILILCAVIIGFAFQNMLGVAFSDNNYLIPPLHQVTRYSNQILSPITPQTYNILFGGITNKIIEAGLLPKNYQAKGYLGIGLIILTILGAMYFRHTHKIKNSIWLVLGITFLILSFGPIAKVFELELRWLPLPYLLVYQYFPFADIVRGVGRLFCVALIGFSVLAGAAWLYLKEKYSEKKAGIILGLLVGFLILDFAYLGMPTEKLTAPNFYADFLANNHEEFKIAEIPSNTKYSAASRSVYYNTFHEHESISGLDFARKGRTNWSWLENTPIINEILYTIPRGEDGGVIKHDVEKISPAIFNKLNLRYIIVHKLPLEDEALTKLYNYLDRTGSKRFHEGENLIVYEVPRTITEPVSYVKLESGFEDLEESTGKTFDGIAEMTAINETGQSEYLNLSIDLEADWQLDEVIKEFDTLYYSVNDEELGSFIVTEKSSSIEIPGLEIMPGENRIKLYKKDEKEKVQDGVSNINLYSIRYDFNTENSGYLETPREEKALIYRTTPSSENYESELLAELGVSAFDPERLNIGYNDKGNAELLNSYSILRHWFLVKEDLEKRLDWDHNNLNKEFFNQNIIDALSEQNIKYLIFPKERTPEHEMFIFTNFFLQRLGGKIVRDEEEYRVFEVPESQGEIVLLRDMGWGETEGPGTTDPRASIEGIASLNLLYPKSGDPKKKQLEFTVFVLDNVGRLEVTIDGNSQFFDITGERQIVNIDLPEHEPGICNITFQSDKKFEELVYIEGLRIIEK